MSFIKYVSICALALAAFAGEGCVKPRRQGRDNAELRRIESLPGYRTPLYEIKRPDYMPAFDFNRYRK